MEGYTLIRGARVLKLIEASYAELERNTMQFQPPSKERQHAVNPIQIQQIELVAAPQSGTLEARAVAQSGNNKYQPIMFFRDVQFEQEQTQQNVTFTGADGQEYSIQPIQLNQNNVQVRCTCLDFRWRFSVQNMETGSLYGPGPGVYQKAPDSTRPPNNPQGKPGLCKHLLKLAIELKNSRVVV